MNRTVARLFRITFVYFQGRIAFPRNVDDRNGNFGNGWSPLVARVPGWELYSSFLSLLGELASIVGARTAKLCIHTCSDAGVCRLRYPSGAQAWLLSSWYDTMSPEACGKKSLVRRKGTMQQGCSVSAVSLDGSGIQRSISRTASR